MKKQLKPYTYIFHADFTDSEPPGSVTKYTLVARMATKSRDEAFIRSQHDAETVWCDSPKVKLLVESVRSSCNGDIFLQDGSTFGYEMTRSGWEPVRVCM